MQRERSQGLNRYYARKRLCELVEEERMGSKSPAALKAEKIRKQKQRRKRRSKAIVKKGEYWQPRPKDGAKYAASGAGGMGYRV